jgi:hypothetical protein
LFCGKCRLSELPTAGMMSHCGNSVQRRFFGYFLREKVVACPAEGLKHIL